MKCYYYDITKITLISNFYIKTVIDKVNQFTLTIKVLTKIL